ncbi:YiiX/YebB-like N1pC/P60 family cysteine hydrolase [Thalassobacillus devorans]|uniref:YiiX/YebB-like N1pC/P60 family cysteine hydrolase n=1 Tax=Thalassobacillus devorans TaxID=279813 RepID=UPI000A1CC577|nr:YiiX/YebB-like N1pC/P60 family cysteine hydrolase [Thalassobacillus devorans]
MGKLPRLITFLFSIIAGTIVFLARPRKARAPIVHDNPETYPGTNVAILPGDLLFSPIGQSESKYVGHVGIVNHNREVIHSIPSGLMKDTMHSYFHKFRSITIYSPKDPDVGRKAADYLENLYEKYPKANYRIRTPLGSTDHEQYCTKIVWQSYYYGAGVNLRNLPPSRIAIHPEWLKDKKVLERKARNL